MLLGLALAAGPVALPAFAQVPIDESISKRDARRLDNMEKVVREMRDIVFKGRDTGKPVVVEPADTDARMAEFTNRISDLEQSLTRINGSLETATHDLDQARKDNAALSAQVKALTDRLTALEQRQEAAAQPPPPAAGPTAAPAADGPTPTEAFAHARQLMLAGNYDGAEGAFRDYVQAYPDAPKTPEARYWWGKTLSVRGAHAEAATAYIGAIRGWPQTTWAPDAVVELARELVALKKPSDACQALAELPKHYPKATSVKARAGQVAAQAKCS
ncbi:tol-pal system protein YbgF [Phenylobacterium soli]|uniref:tol-pal system protein YbgF n=1 Tax=Phenylobacterium soli TaxID=2170551 RepID=UPI001D039731|nr:tol-pal system protein YbgF [Phenylobacterium soli]